MSEQQLKAFREAIQAEACLQDKLKAAEDVDAIIAIAKTVGFVISAEDLARAAAELPEDLAAIVTGGAYPTNVNGQITD